MQRLFSHFLPCVVLINGVFLFTGHVGEENTSGEKAKKKDTLDFVLLVLMHRFVEQIRVDFHKKLQRVVNHPMDGPEGGVRNHIWKCKNATTCRFQCDLELVYRAGKTMGRMMERLSLMRLTTYSLFQ